MSDLSDDLLVGAQAIADHLGWSVRRVYHLADKGALPVNRLKAASDRWGLITARKSELDRALSADAAA